MVYFLTLSTEGKARNYIGGDQGNSSTTPKNTGFRGDCTESRAETDLNINNVRARLRAGGDMWWDGQQARYIVPNVDPASGEPEISSLFAGGIWVGAYDQGGNLILAAQTFRDQGNDYWPGPLDSFTGDINKTECANWDQHFTVYGQDIDALRADFLDPLSPGVDNTPSQGLLGWPAKGNSHFLAIHGFDIRGYNQDLAPFIDVNGDGRYDPWDGDHPVVEVSGCDRTDYNAPVYADQMTWWVYNDNGNLHSQTGGNPMNMEIQALAFGYSTTDAVNNMTFYRYKLLNRNALRLENTYFSLWTDPDLGCSEDDYIGCDTATGMGYVYNSDAVDDNPCGTAGTAGYGAQVPALAVDYFKGPLDTAGNEIGLSSFQYYRRGTGPMGDPQTAIQHYRLMSGFWLDGTPVTEGGDGYDTDANAVATRYVFPAFPDDSSPEAWSMCKEGLSGLDQRFLHTSGPFVLLPGATNEMISGVVWVPEVPYNGCASLTSLVSADKLAQTLFDDCFKITSGPDAPNMDVIEMDQELVLNLSYNGGSPFDYIESPSILAQHAPLDTSYRFQGYKIYQVSGPNVSVTELDDENKASLIFQCDVEDDITTIANWEEFKNDAAQIDLLTPVIKVEGENKGLKHTFRILEDQFAPGQKDLINHKQYYFCVVAYGHNEYEPYDVRTEKGQDQPYLQGRRNFRIYTGIPRMNAPEYSGIELQSEYGNQPEITRLDGQGAGGASFLDIENIEEVEATILAGNHVETITYKGGNGPLNIKVVDPLRVPAGTFQVHVCDEAYNWLYDAGVGAYIPQPATVNALADSIYWVLSDANDPSIIWSSYQTMDWAYEQYIPDLGISIQIEQKDKPSHNGAVGFVGSRIDYEDNTYGEWYDGVKDGTGIFNMLKTGGNESDQKFDPEQLYAESEGGWYPFMLCDAQRDFDGPYLSLGNIASDGAKYRNDTLPGRPITPDKVRDTLLSNLNNVNIVMSPDRSEWSRCIVVETASFYYGNSFLGSVSPNWKIPSRRAQMEWKGSIASIFRPTHPVYPSRNKDMSIDNSSVGMSWFPGYAYNVETGERLNIFFGENSLYNGSVLAENLSPGSSTGDDMIFNPTNTGVSGPFSTDEKVQLLQNVQGGQHIIYVTDHAYDSCKSVLAEFDKVSNNSLLTKDIYIYKNMVVTWASMAVPTTMTGTYGEVPPTKARIKLRVDRPFEIEEGTNQNLGYPLYEFSLDKFAPTKESQEAAVSALDLMRVVPNPYYAYSDYEVLEIDNVIKITNIPAKCNIRIYSLDGRFVKEYKVAQAYNSPAKNGIARIGQGNEGANADAQVTTSVDWDVKNYANVPVAAGVYLIHIQVEGVGTKVLKSFVINRAFDAQRL